MVGTGGTVVIVTLAGVEVLATAVCDTMAAVAAFWATPASGSES